MITAAIDPSIRATGFVVIQDGKPVLYGRTPLRTAAQVEALVAQLAAFSPDVVAIEASFISVNAKTGIDLAELRGRLRQCLESRGMACTVVAPSSWRKSAFGKCPRRKRAEWKQVAVERVAELFGLTVSNDEAEAVLLGVAATDLLVSHLALNPKEGTQ